MSSKYSELLVKITPTQEEQKILSKATKLLIEISTKSSFDFPLHSIMPCGSIAKGTNLGNTADIDLFAILHTTDKRLLDQYARVVGERVTKHLHTKLEIAFADNPYALFFFKYKKKKIPVNLVPTIHVSDEVPLARALSISGMARTPLHTEYAKTKLQGFEGDIRLLKYFSQQKRIYGIFGLTGWLCELLVLHYGSFEKTLEAISQWVSPVIDLTHTHAANELKRKFSSSLVIILDPIDPDRNAAAGIQGFMGQLMFQRLKRVAAQALSNPSSTFVKLQPNGNVIIQLQRTQKYMIETTAVSLVGGFVNKLAHSLQQYDYKVEDAWVNLNSYQPQVIMEFNTTSNPTIKIQGPPTSMKDASQTFFKKHENTIPFKEENRWWVIVNSKYPQIKDAIQAFKPGLKGFYTVKAINVK
jgi:tRNA nucleotidyltransferase (CCA-adding enzyme)